MTLVEKSLFGAAAAIVDVGKRGLTCTQADESGVAKLKDLMEPTDFS